MSITEQLAHESKLQLLKAMQELSADAPLADRLKLINEASRLLERTETKTTQVTHLGDA